MRGSLKWTFLFLLIFALLPDANIHGAESGSRNVILSTTTSTQDSGLLDVLIPLFEKQSGYAVKTVSVGTGQALALAAKGDADVALVHAPSLEKKYVSEGTLLHRRLVMYNDFVIIGPKDDPAKVRAAKTSAAALKAIEQARAAFVSRGDNSGTHALEKILWKSAGIDPKGSWYIEAGQGMGATLGIASERNAYTITDRGTLLALAKRVNLPILVEGDRALLNIYSVLEVNPANGPRVNSTGGKAFADFMVAPQTQNVIKSFGVEKFGQSLFVPVAGKKKKNWERSVELIWQGIAKAVELVVGLDPEVWAVTWLSLKISGGATAISLLLGIPLGILLAMARFPGRSVIAAAVNTGMGLPPVVVGLFVSMFLWRSGPLGFLELIYSPAAMVVAQVIIAFPIVAGLTMASFQSLDPKLTLQLLGIGASKAQLLWILCKEARLPLLAAVMAGFGGVISEVGASMMVGGNIRGQTRVLTTATVLETGKGNFDIAIALSVILLSLTFAINFFLTRIQQREHLRWPKVS